VILWFASAVATAAAGVVDRVAAVVGDDVISLSEIYELAGTEFIVARCPTLDDTCVTEAELEVLDVLLRRTLIRQELVRLNDDVTEADVDQAIDNIVRQYALPSRQALREEVEHGTPPKRWDQYREELKEYLRTQSFQGRVLLPRISIREDELLDEYNRTARDLQRPYARVSAFGIPIDTAQPPEDQQKMVEQIQILVTAIREGRVSWDDAVAQYDGAGVSSMFTGRDFTKGTLLEEVDAVVFSSPIGAVADPVRVGDVWYVLRVDERGNRTEAASFEEAKPRLHEQLQQSKIEEAEEEWYQRARREAAIDIKLAV
jgi:peptidyl-prolyl cis-trans isomerase SurA